MSQQAETTLDYIVANMATKDDLKAFAKKEDLKGFASKDDLKPFATKNDLQAFATKTDIMGLEERIIGGVNQLIQIQTDHMDKEFSLIHEKFAVVHKELKSKVPKDIYYDDQEELRRRVIKLEKPNPKIPHEKS